MTNLSLALPSESVCQKFLSSPPPKRILSLSIWPYLFFCHYSPSHPQLQMWSLLSLGDGSSNLFLYSIQETCDVCMKSLMALCSSLYSSPALFNRTLLFLQVLLLSPWPHPLHHTQPVMSARLADVYTQSLVTALAQRLCE